MRSESVPARLPENDKGYLIIPEVRKNIRGDCPSDDTGGSLLRKRKGMKKTVDAVRGIVLYWLGYGRGLFFMPKFITEVVSCASKDYISMYRMQAA